MGNRNARYERNVKSRSSQRWLPPAVLFRRQLSRNAGKNLRDLRNLRLNQTENGRGN